jgi:hypothetical protein
MSMHPHPILAIPEETARVERAVLPRVNVYLQMRDELGTLTHQYFAHLCVAPASVRHCQREVLLPAHLQSTPAAIDA